MSDIYIKEFSIRSLNNGFENSIIPAIPYPVAYRYAFEFKYKDLTYILPFPHIDRNSLRLLTIKEENSPDGHDAHPFLFVDMCFWHEDHNQMSSRTAYAFEETDFMIRMGWLV